MAAVLVLAPLGGPADAKKKKKAKRIERTAEATYDTPAIGHPDAVVVCTGSKGCANFPIGDKEFYIKLEITDTTGLPVYARASQDVDGDGLGDNSFTFCGSTPEPVAIQPGFEVNVFIGALPGTNPSCNGVATTGKVRATISNLP